jgi:hypothetical protein
MVVEKAKGAAATGDKVNSFFERLLCTWDPTHRMELVANDIRVDREDVDVELMAVPWYSQTPKNIAAIYATCSYGNQYEELLETAGHLGERWYAMVKFCETRFAQSELKVYINIEKNYKTYRRACGGNITKAEAKAKASSTTTTTTVATTTEEATATTVATTTTTSAVLAAPTTTT